MKWVVDASVAAKWVAPEPESALADLLLGHELLVPDLFYAELANILWKKQMRGEMTPAAAAAAVRWMLELPLAVHDSAGLMADALNWAARLRHPAYDGFYLALAARAGCALVTADSRLAERCRQGDVAELGGRVVLLGDGPVPAAR